MPNATVTVRNTDLSTARIVTSGRDGAFRVTGLIPGSYTVDAKADKLALRRPVRVTVTLRSSTEIALKLEIPRVRESTTVRARAATVEGNTVAPPANTTETAVTTFLPGLTITYLPNRDRDITQFTNLTAAAQEDSEGTGVILAGQRANAIATQVDGTSFDDALLGGRRAAEDGVEPGERSRDFQYFAQVEWHVEPFAVGLAMGGDLSPRPPPRRGEGVPR